MRREVINRRQTADEDGSWRHVNDGLVLYFATDRSTRANICRQQTMLQHLRPVDQGPRLFGSGVNVPSRSRALVW